MTELEQFIDNLTKTEGWAGQFSVDWERARISATSSMPLTFTVDGDINTTLAADGRNVTYALERPTLAQAMTDFAPVIDALFAAKAEQYGFEVAYPALAAAS